MELQPDMMIICRFWIECLRMLMNVETIENAKLPIDCMYLTYHTYRVHVQHGPSQIGK